MSPEKTKPDGWYRLDRHLKGVGRIRVRSGSSLKMHHRVDSLVTKLHEQGRLDLLRQLKRKKLTSMQLIDADRRNVSASDPVTARLADPLFATAEALFAGKAPTIRRYRISFVQLAQLEILKPNARIQDLASVDWGKLNARWARSDADWNHLQRAISRLLSLHLGKHTEQRAELLQRIPVREELERLVELTPPEFMAIVKPAPAALQHCFWTLAATGLRAEAEYHQLTEADLGRYQVRVKRSKNSESLRVVPVDPRLWPHVLEAVPCPFKPDFLSRAWAKLAKLAGRPEIWLRDLRHCYAFWSLAAGIDLNVVREAMGHRSLETTQKYLRQLATRSHASALADVLVKSAPKKRKRA